MSNNEQLANGNGGLFDRFVHSLMPQPDDLEDIQQQQQDIRQQIGHLQDSSK